MATHASRPGLQLVRMDRAQAEEVRRTIEAVAGLPSDVAREILALVERRTVASDTWRFVMVDPQRNFEVVQWITRHARRTPTSHLLWAAIKGNLHSGTNEVLMNRAQMMQATGSSSPHVSEALSEFVSIGAIERHKEGREVRWFLNTKAATHQSGAARDEAQRSSPQLLTRCEAPKP